MVQRFSPALRCYALARAPHPQLTLLDAPPDRAHQLSDALDRLNDRYGEFVVTPALMMGMDNLILDRIAFGRVKDWRTCISRNA